MWRYGAGKLTHFTDKDGLTGNAVNIIYRDQNGELWFGTDKDGIFKFNGNSFENFQVKNK
ncbi:MAG: two-component regulator propeller domain-containing protein [Bacteroidota bacterium]